MSFLRKFLDSLGTHFEGDGKLKKFYPIYEMLDTFLYTPLLNTKGSVHVKDSMDLKRVMFTVVVALIPCMLIGIFNTGYQINLSIDQLGSTANLSQLIGCRFDLLNALGFKFGSSHYITSFALGLTYFLPIYIVTQVVGGFWEVLFSVIRKHEINEGFLVTGTLFPLILPATIPLWQVAVGVSFGVVFGKEIFGGTGKNFLNPALVGRAFLFFAYPAYMSGDSVWLAVDGVTGATALGQVVSGGMSSVSTTWLSSFIGLIPGSLGETSTIACLFGAVVLIVTGVGSWRTMLSMFLSFSFFILLLTGIGSETNMAFSMSLCWHLVVGGFAFGTVFMATDPVSSAQTLKGQLFYGALIGFMVALVRVINPAFPEGTMLAILFGNCLAPLIDYFVIQNYKKRRKFKKDVSYAA